MRLTLEATPGELRARGSALVRELSERVRPHAPDLAAQLQKAADAPEPMVKEMRHQTLQDSREQVGALYRRQLALMVDEIGQVLDDAVRE